MKLIKTNETPINDLKIINQIRSLGLDMIHEAKSGHPGIVLGAAPILYTLYAKHLRFDVRKPDFFNRDRFIMSAGHGSALLYATLFMAGFIELEDLKQFRKIDSKTPGHPELNQTYGVDMTTGPLGQGLATAVGMALAEAKLEAQYEKIKKDFIGFNTYVLCSDGDLEEGISYEACSLAGTLKLNRLIVLYDSNSISLDGPTKNSFTENIEMRFTSMGWNYIKVADGEDYDAIDKALIDAKKQTDKPTLIEVKTIIGKYSKDEGTNKIHGGDIEDSEITAIKDKLKLRDIAFNVTNDTVEDFQYMIQERNENIVSDFETKFSSLPIEEQTKLKSLIEYNYPIDLKQIVYEKPQENIEALKDTSSKVLTSLVKNNDFIFGGSADVFIPTNTYVQDASDFSSKNYLGKNIFFGVRENSMGAILNGLSLIGFRGYGSTFLAFSDYMRPSIRMAALLNLPVVYIFTHDSISIGEDGPTHQPVEQLVSLRAIPNLEVFRPCDANEVIGVYKTIMKKTAGPSVISLSKTKLPILETTSSNGVEKGAYIVKAETRKLDGIIISTGEEVHQAIEVSKRLNVKGIDIRVVSMPSIKRFLDQDSTYIDEILPVGVKKIVIEAGSSLSWNRLIFNPKYLITLDSFGYSGSKDEVYKKCGFDVDSLEEKIELLLK